jgi:light-regulated signal transduction histidine kinase (bacteriophytochrome)
MRELMTTCWNTLIDTVTKEFVAVDSMILQETLALLKVSIEQAMPDHCEPLPKIEADESQMMQLCTSSQMPSSSTVRTAEDRHFGFARCKEWIFAVKDNGIGLNTKYV